MDGEREGLKAKVGLPWSKPTKKTTTPSLVDRNEPYFSGIHRFGLKKVSLYWSDPFHTLLNMPWVRFIILFFTVYLLQFMVFGFIYWLQPNHCVIGKDGKFAYALWLSSRTSSTLGYDMIHPNAACSGTNITVMVQVIASSLIDFIMLGLVFARFSAPYRRAATVKFSTVAVLHRHESGFWCLEARVANVRKHQILKPEIKMAVTAMDSTTPSTYLFEYLSIDGLERQETNMQLGFPANLVHVIDQASPLFNLSVQEMEARMMEIILLFDGVDAMTSKHLQARWSYSTSDMKLNEQFVPLHLELRKQKLGLNFADFNATTEVVTDVPAETIGEESHSGKADTLHMVHLRHQTFKKLTGIPVIKSQGPSLPVSTPAPPGEDFLTHSSSWPQHHTSFQNEVKSLCEGVLADRGCNTQLKQQAALLLQQVSSMHSVGAGSSGFAH